MKTKDLLNSKSLMPSHYAWSHYNSPWLEIDFSSHGSILLPGVSICIALFGIEEQFFKHYRFYCFIDLEFNFKVFAVILLHL
jgi:hypothetical protein